MRREIKLHLIYLKHFFQQMNNFYIIFFYKKMQFLDDFYMKFYIFKISVSIKVTYFLVFKLVGINWRVFMQFLVFNIVVLIQESDIFDFETHFGFTILWFSYVILRSPTGVGTGQTKYLIWSDPLKKYDRLTYI